MFSKKRIAARHPKKNLFRQKFGRKSPPGRNPVPLLITIGLILAIVFLIFSTDIKPVFFPGNFKLIIPAKTFSFDYFALLSNSLPGLSPRGDAEKLNREAGVLLQAPFWRDYPQILLCNELAGLRVLEADKTFSPSAVGGDPDALGLEWGAKEEEKGAVFLTEINAEQAREKPFISGEEKPLLLIYHTHTSESFLPVSGKIYTDDPEGTVVFLGAALSKILQEEYGIPVLHHQEVFDRPRSKAYQTAAPVIEKILQENPQIEVVLDLHRDGVPRRVTTANILGEEAARVLFVIETRQQEWSGNLRFALFLESILQDRYPGFSRGILKRVFANYNQHLHPRSLIVEIGGHENNREELKRSIPMLAEALGEAFR
ncbi:MAG: stage II sporulation protein P [Firmicutes bacterium]|nr:stage II sporulation protein P [Bacillota bacterium]